MATLVERALLASQLSHHDRVQGCVAYESSVDPSYGYRPSIVAGIVFVVVFFLTMSTHFVQTTIKRSWWYSLFAVGALGKLIIQEMIMQAWLTLNVGELLGWIARLWSWRCPYNNTAFVMQISVLIIGPLRHLFHAKPRH